MVLRNKPVLAEFGHSLVDRAYDRTAWYLEHVFSGHMKGSRQRELANLYQSLDERSQDVVRQFATEAMTAMLADTLNLFEEREIGIAYTSRDGQLVDIREISDGLVGELFTDLGWIAQFSKYKEGLKSPPTEPVPELVIEEGAIIVGLDHDDDDGAGDDE
jgi:hypothetical protein